MSCAAPGSLRPGSDAAEAGRKPLSSPSPALPGAKPGRGSDDGDGPGEAAEVLPGPASAPPAPAGPLRERARPCRQLLHSSQTLR